MCWSTKSPKVLLKYKDEQNLQKYFQNSNTIKSPKVILDLKYEQNLQKVKMKLDNGQNLQKYF